MDTHESSSNQKLIKREQRTSPNRSSPLFVRLAFLAIALVPLQQAFTIDVGSPLKPTELLMATSIASWILSTRKVRSVIGFKPILGIVAVILASASFQLILGAPVGDYLGYIRSPQSDLLFYTVYPIFILFMWRVVSDVPHGIFQTAIKVSIWICFAGILFQVAMMQLDRIDILEDFSYQTNIRSESLSGSGEGAMRNGTFTEGQHLGFFAAGAALIAWRRRWYVSLLVALGCLAYSQSTTGIVGLVVVVMILLFSRPSTSAALKIGVGLAASFIAFVVVDTLRNLVFLQLAKLGLASSNGQLEGATASAELRTLKTEIAWRMMWDHPFLGVGPGRYGFWYFKDPASSNSPAWYFLSNHRSIAENVYMQVGAELGVVGLILFVIFLWRLFVEIRVSDRTLLGVFLLIVIGIATQSSWTFIPIWIYSAFIVAGIRSSRFVRPPVLARSNDRPSLRPIGRNMRR